MATDKDTAPKFLTPVLDLDQPHGEIYGSGEDPARWVQGGHYFRANREYLRSDEGAKMIAHQAPVEAAPEPGSKPLDESLIEAALEDPRAADMLLLPLDKLAAMVDAAGGPSFSGDHAIRNNVAWLLQHTV